MQEFEILGQKITFSTERINYYILTMKYQAIANEASQQLKNQYSKLGNLKNVVQNLEQAAFDIYAAAVKQSLDYIQQQNIYTIDFEGLLDECSSYFDDFFGDPFETVCDKYADIIGEQNEAAEYRRMRKASRSKYSGYGFGISGAISSSVKAGTLNMATGLGHSLFNAVGNAGSSAVSAAKQSSLYNDQKVISSLMDGIYRATYLLCFKVINVIESQTNIKYENIPDKELAQAHALSNNILRHAIPEHNICDAIIQSLAADPQNKELLQYTIINYGDADCSIEQMGEFFGYDLKPVKKVQIEKIFGNIEQKNYKAESELLKEKDSILQKCSEYGLDPGSYISIIDAKWLEIDKALRMVEGVEYETRDIARNIEKDIATFYEKCGEIPWDDVNLLEESCRNEYEMKLKDVAYLEEIFTSQVRKRLDIIWKPYIYRQDIIHRLSNPETILEQLNEIVTDELFYKNDLKKRIYFHDIAENKKTKTPALSTEDGVGLLYIDHTILGGCKKGTIFTTRKLIEYEKEKNSQVTLAEIKEIKPENGHFSVLDVQGDIALTLDTPTYLSDKNTESYAALLNALAIGLSRTDVSLLENKLTDTVQIEPTEYETPENNNNTEQAEQPQHPTSTSAAECNTSAADLITDETLQCPNCGNTIQKNGKFCSHCGMPTANYQKTYQPANDIIYCSECGNKIKVGKKFCSQCGTKVK